MNGELPNRSEWASLVFGITNEAAFQSIALQLYQFQYQNNPVYQQYCNALGHSGRTVTNVKEIPFLPISFFKSHPVITTSFEPELIFKSSGTTGQLSSTHFVKSSALYEQSFCTGFEQIYGPVQEYCIIGLLPSYLEKGFSSLVYMVQHLINKSGHAQSGFYLHNYQALNDTLLALEAAGQKTILFGVTYALLDFAEQFSPGLQHTIIIETGGMKGRGKELIKAELYQQLQHAFGVSAIHAEYGMTELLSQAYAVNGIFKTPPWMKVMLREENDPFHLYNLNSNATGAINVIDLANVYSCCFIATDDVGKTYNNGGFEVLGRIDYADMRGCSQLVL